jgi:uncharacterized membrane protein YtjA (UPF0391 family)
LGLAAACRNLPNAAGNRRAPPSIDGFEVASGVEAAMLKWAVVFLLIAIVAGIFGFTDIAEASATIAQWLFGIFLVLFLGALVIGLALGGRLFS